MAAIANSSDSCHEAELDASCLLSDNYVSSRFMETTAALTAHALPNRNVSLVTVAWLIKISYVAMAVPTSSLYVTEQGGRDGRELLAAWQERRD